MLTTNWLDVGLAALKNGAWRQISIEGLLWQAGELVFTPSKILQQLWLVTKLQFALSSMLWGYGLGVKIVANVFRWTKVGKKETLRKQLKEASNYDEWYTHANVYDNLTGSDVWRADPRSTAYDYGALRSRIAQLRRLSDPVHGDKFTLIFRLRGGLSRPDYGLVQPGIYTRAKSGTKLVLEEYLETVTNSLRYIAGFEDDVPDEPDGDSDGSSVSDSIPTDAKLAFFNEMRHAFGRSALLLSGGPSMGFYHIGVLKALFEQGFLPRVVLGSAAGSIIAAGLSIRTDEELEEFLSGDEAHYGFFQPIDADPLQGSGLLDSEKLKAGVQRSIGDYTFQEAFDRTGRILNIIVAPKNAHDPPRLLNYLTAPHVVLWSAVVCSSAIPHLCQPSPLFVREPDGFERLESELLYQDGSMDASLPMAQLTELFNVNHFIESQVNPHATLFEKLSLETLSRERSLLPIFGMAVSAVDFLKAQMKDWLENVVTLVTFSKNLPRSALTRLFIQVMLQDYKGRDCDITIFPWRGHMGVLRAFLASPSLNPTREECEEMIHVAEWNTWEQMGKIKCHCQLEVTLEQCVQMLRRRLQEEEFDDAAAGSMGGYGEPSALASSKSRMGRVPSFFTSPSSEDLCNLNTHEEEPMTPNHSDKIPAPIIGFSGHAVVDNVALKSRPPLPTSTSESELSFDGSMAAFYYSGQNKYSSESLAKKDQGQSE